MARMQILFDGFADLAESIDRAGNDLHKAVDEALQATQQLVKDNLTTAAAVYDSNGLKGYATGQMYKAIIDDTSVDWAGSVASVRVGFNLSQAGGWHSIFVMYGTPRMAKDTQVYNAIKGTRTKKEIAQKQQEVMQKYVNLEG